MKVRHNIYNFSKAFTLFAIYEDLTEIDLNCVQNKMNSFLRDIG